MCKKMNFSTYTMCLLAAMCSFILSCATSKVDTQQITGNQNKVLMPAKPGKCYAKCRILDEDKNTVEITEWREVVCSDDITPELIGNIQTVLVVKGYDIGESGVTNVLGEETKAALVRYQKENNLPLGQMDIETMKSLGIYTKT